MYKEPFTKEGVADAIGMLEEGERRKEADIAGAAAIRLGVSDQPQWQIDAIMEHEARGGAMVSETAKALAKKLGFKT